MRAKVDDELCVNCGLCADMCPNVFRMEDDIAIGGEIKPDDKERAQEAAEDCPGDAIEIEE